MNMFKILERIEKLINQRFDELEKLLLKEEVIEVVEKPKKKVNEK